MKSVLLDLNFCKKILRISGVAELTGLWESAMLMRKLIKKPSKVK